MPASNEPCAGFTLLEALIALTILSGTTATVMMLIATNRQAQAHAEADLSATLNARTLLTRLGRDLPLEIGTRSGILEDGQAWTVQITPYRPEIMGEAVQKPALLQIRISLRDRRVPSSTVDVFTLKEAAK